MKRKHIWVAGMVFVGLFAVTTRADAPDPALPAYKPGPPLQGKLSTKGADALAEMMKLWIAMFQRVQPGIQWHFETGAPTTSPQGLEDGTADIGYNGRTLWDPEIVAITKAHGRPPRSFRVAISNYDYRNTTLTMGAFVHAANPLRQITLKQLDAIYSSSRRRGAPAAITTWGQLGLTGPWADQPVHAYTTKLLTGPMNDMKWTILQRGNPNPAIQGRGRTQRSPCPVARLQEHADETDDGNQRSHEFRDEPLHQL